MPECVWVTVCLCLSVCVCVFSTQQDLLDGFQKKIPEIIFYSMDGSSQHALRLGPPCLSSDPLTAQSWGNNDPESAMPCQT